MQLPARGREGLGCEDGEEEQERRVLHDSVDVSMTSSFHVDDETTRRFQIGYTVAEAANASFHIFLN